MANYLSQFPASQFPADVVGTAAFLLTNLFLINCLAICEISKIPSKRYHHLFSIKLESFLTIEPLQFFLTQMENVPICVGRKKLKISSKQLTHWLISLHTA